MGHRGSGGVPPKSDALPGTLERLRTLRRVSRDYVLPSQASQSNSQQKAHEGYGDAWKGGESSDDAETYRGINRASKGYIECREEVR